MPIGLIVLLTVSLAFAGAASLWEYSSDVAPVITALRIISSISVIIIYAPSAARSYLKPRSEIKGRDHLLAGIMLTWSTATAFAMANDIGRLINVSINTTTSAAVGLFGAWIVLAAVFHASAPGVARPRRVAFAIIAATILFGLFRFAMSFVGDAP